MGTGHGFVQIGELDKTRGWEEYPFSQIINIHDRTKKRNIARASLGPSAERCGCTGQVPGVNCVAG